ncbi:MAG: hypothetical protein PHP28_13630 [Actinomycetota bacterium]|nr:hypothetical protein [Actinomycetota bacterium]
MKKFMIRGSCFAAIGLMLLYTLSFFYVRTNGYRSLDDMFKFYDMPDDIEVANLGSSHGAYGFDYENISGITGFNFALPGQSLYYDLQVLEEYSDKLSEGCVVVIPISYFSFDQNKISEDQTRWYYKILDYGSVYNHKLTDYVKIGLFPILGASLNAKYLIKDKPAVAFDIYWLYAFSGIDYDVEDVEAWKRDALGFLDFHNKVTAQGRNEEFNLPYLYGIIEYCQEHGFKPLLVTTPFTRYYNEVFTEEFYRDFHAKVTKIQEKYGIPYIDYSHDPRMTEDLGLFVDSNHLNAAGSKVFTKLLLSDLGLI